MTNTIYQRFTYWFAPLLFSVFVLSYQNCSDVGFRRIGGNEGPGGTGLACLPDNFDLNMSVSTVALNQPVTFSVEPPATNTTYTWTLNGDDVGTGPVITRTFTADGAYSMRVSAMKDDCENPRSKTVNFNIESAPVCNLTALALTGDSWGMVSEMLDYAVNHNCADLTFAWNAGDGTVVTNTNNEMQHAWMSPGVYIVSTDVIDGANQQRLSMPVSIQSTCPALGDLFVSAPDVAYVNQVVPFDIVIPGCLNISSINWSFGADSNPPSSTVKQTQTTYSSPGVKNVNVVITDGEGNSITLPHRITILSNTVPGCNEDALLTLTGPTSANINETLRFGVYVPSCIEATAFTWNFGDSTAGSGNPVNKSYTAAGIYTVSVIVSTVNHGFITLSRRVVIHAPTSYSWVPGEWGACVGPCSSKDGTQSRVYECRDNNGDKVDSSLCTEPQPQTEVRSCQVPVESCTCPDGQVNNGSGVCVPATGLCLLPPPAVTYINYEASLPNPLCLAGQHNPATVVVNPGATTIYTCIGQVGDQTGCRIHRCTNDQYVKNGSCVSCGVGLVPNAARTACVPCLENQIENPNGTCTNCPAGQVNNGLNVCTPVVTYSWREIWSNCSGACGTNAGSQTSSYQCVNNSGVEVADSFCTTPKPSPQTRACTVASNSCTCIPPKVNVGGVCVTPINGTCKVPPHGGTYSSPPAAGSANLCATGTASTVTTNAQSYNWTCSGSNTGTNANCSANRVLSCPAGYHASPANDVCVQWRYTASGCSSNSCGVTGTTTYTSVCVNTNGVQATGCNQSLNQPPQGVSCNPNPNTCTCTPPKVNVGGVCVTPSNGACLNPNPRVLTLNQAVPTNICQSGSASPNHTSVPAGGQVTFNCLGSNGTNANNCQIARHECAIGATRGCTAANGTGTQRCDTGYWGSCQPTSCNCGYALVNGTCQYTPYVTNTFNPGVGSDGVDRVRETQWISGCGLTAQQATNYVGSHQSAWMPQPPDPNLPSYNTYHRNRICEPGFELVNSGGISNGCLRRGSCGSAQGGTFENLTSGSSGLCGVGQVLSFTATSAGWAWSCRFENWNWGAASCSANRSAPPVNASCGTAHQKFAIVASFPPGSLCTSGTAPLITPLFPVAPNYRSEWTCQGVNGGSNASCVAYGYNVGNCGSTFGNCIDGTPGNLNSVARTWTCKGAKGASNPELPTTHPGYSSHVRQCSL